MSYDELQRITSPFDDKHISHFPRLADALTNLDHSSESPNILSILKATTFFFYLKKYLLYPAVGTYVLHKVSAAGYLAHSYF